MFVLHVTKRFIQKKYIVVKLKTFLFHSKSKIIRHSYYIQQNVRSNSITLNLTTTSLIRLFKTKFIVKKVSIHLFLKYLK